MDNLGFQHGEICAGKDNDYEVVRNKEQNYDRKRKDNSEKVTCIKDFVDEGDKKQKIEDKQRKKKQAALENIVCRRINSREANIELKSEINDLEAERKFTSQKDLEDNFHVGARPVQTLQQVLSKKLSNGKCSVGCLKRFVCSIFPFINILKNYNIKEDITGDIVAGLTVGILHIPQGMAYAMLATLPPIYGLYTSFFPVLIYFFFGSSKHISLGTASVPCLMTGSAVSKGIDVISGSITSLGSVPTVFGNSAWNVAENITEHHAETTTIPTADDISGMSQEELDLRLQFAMSVTFMVGVIQLLMAIFRLGFITDYMSDALISGFTTGVACHVLTSQVKNIFSVKLTSYSGTFKLIYTYRDFFKTISTINYVTVLLSVSSMLVLYFTSRFINQNPKLRPKMFMPVPAELIVVVIGTVISYVINLEQTYSVAVVSDIPVGLPVPNTNGLSRISWTILLDVFPIVVVIFSISISIAKLLAKKHNYEVDANQELLAFGMASVVCSFMSSVAPMAAMSRAVVQDRVGGKTQVTGLVSCCLLIVVLLAIGPYFKTTPKCVLASVIVISLRALFLQILDLKSIYRVSKTEFFVWIVACVSTVLLDVDLGLVVAVGFNVLVVIYRVQRPYFNLMGQLPGTNFYGDVNVYREAKEIPGIKIFKYEQSLFFLNKEHFRSCLFKHTVNPATLKIAQEKRERKLNTVQKKKDFNISVIKKSQIDSTKGQQRNRSDVEFHTIILDCSSWSFVDSMGVKVLSAAISEYKEVSVNVLLANYTEGVLETFESTTFYKTLEKSNIYVTLQEEAVSQALCYQSSTDSVQSNGVENRGADGDKNNVVQDFSIAVDAEYSYNSKNEKM